MYHVSLDPLSPPSRPNRLHTLRLPPTVPVEYPSKFSSTSSPNHNLQFPPSVTLEKLSTGGLVGWFKDSSSEEIRLGE